MEDDHKDLQDSDYDSVLDSRTPEHDDEDYYRSKFYGAGVYNCEDLERYEPNGFPPIHLGDLYDSGRYRISGKLGYGRFATVWLARDLEDERWIVLKFLVAEESADYMARASAVLEDPRVAASSFSVNTER